MEQIYLLESRIRDYDEEGVNLYFCKLNAADDPQEVQEQLAESILNWLFDVEWSGAIHWRRDVDMSGRDMNWKATYAFDCNWIEYAGDGNDFSADIAESYNFCERPANRNCLVYIDTLCVLPSEEYYTKAEGIKDGTGSLLAWGEKVTKTLHRLYQEKFGSDFYLLANWKRLSRYQRLIDVAEEEGYTEYVYSFNGRNFQFPSLLQSIKED
jgi:hypothetical protein